MEIDADSVSIGIYKLLARLLELEGGRRGVILLTEERTILMNCERSAQQIHRGIERVVIPEAIKSK